MSEREAAATAIERRAAVELRAVAGRKLQGYAAVFNTRADIMGLFTETVAPGAFAASLASGTDMPSRSRQR